MKKSVDNCSFDYFASFYPRSRTAFASSLFTTLLLFINLLRFTTAFASFFNLLLATVLLATTTTTTTTTTAGFACSFLF